MKHFSLMEDIPHRKLLRGVIIIMKDDRDKVLDFLGSYSLTCHVREVKLTPEDEERLSQFHD